MRSGAQTATASKIRKADEPAHHVIVVIKDVRCRQAVARQLEGCDYRVTLSAAYGLVEVLAAPGNQFDLLITTQSLGEMAQFGLPQLARSVDPALPILVLDCDAVFGDGLVSAVRDAIGRWPLRDRPSRRLH